MIVNVHYNLEDMETTMCCVFKVCKRVAWLIFAYLFCLLIAFAYSLEPDQARLMVGPDLDPNGLTL